MEPLARMARGPEIPRTHAGSLHKDNAQAPAEQREVVAHGLGQVAGVAQILYRRRAVAL